jgi:hypothetical protein
LDTSRGGLFRLLGIGRAMSWFSSSERRKKLATGGFYSIRFWSHPAARVVRGSSERRCCARRAYLKNYDTREKALRCKGLLLFLTPSALSAAASEYQAVANGRVTPDSGHDGSHFGRLLDSKNAPRAEVLATGRQPVSNCLQRERNDELTKPLGIGDRGDIRWGKPRKLRGRRKVFFGAEIAPVEDFNRAISAASRARPD